MRRRDRRPRGDAAPAQGQEGSDATWIVGRKPLAEALESEVPLGRVWIADEPGALSWWRAHEQAARERGAVVTVAPRAALDRLAAGAVHQGVIARASEASAVELEEMLDGCARPALLVLADGVEDPRNLGAMIRSAAAAGCGGVVLPERRSAPLTPVVAKAAAGALSRVPLARAKNTQRALEVLRDRGVWTVALVAGERPIWDVDLTLPTCLIVGGEGRGVSRLARDRADTLAGIPLAGEVESLNASVAVSVALVEAVRQRRKAP